MKGDRNKMVNLNSGVRREYLPILLVLIQGCVAHPGGYYINADGLKVPNRWSGEIANPNKWTNDLGIDYEKLYVHDFVSSAEAGKVMVQRFWSNGRMCAWVTSRDKLDEAGGRPLPLNTIVGRFMIKGSQITYETVGVDEGGARFVRNTGNILPNGEISYFMGNLVGLYHDVSSYRPVAVALAPQRADW